MWIKFINTFLNQYFNYHNTQNLIPNLTEKLMSSVYEIVIPYCSEKLIGDKTYMDTPVMSTSYVDTQRNLVFEAGLQKFPKLLRVFF